MLGLSDPWIIAAYALSVLSALICLGWGLLYWNREDPVITEPESDIKHWAEEEDRVEAEL